MNILRVFWKKLSQKQNLNFWAWVWAVVGLGGFLDATYLTVKHYSGIPISCSIFEGCQQVTTSPYAVIGGLPVALWGAIYYLVIFALAVFYLDTKQTRVMLWAAELTIIGLGASIYFLFLQVFIIKALCFYCVISAVTSTLLFIVRWPVKCLLAAINSKTVV